MDLVSGLVPLEICYFDKKDISFSEIKFRDAIACLSSGVYVTEFGSYWYFQISIMF